MLRGRGAGQRPEVATRLLAASELQESPPAMDRSLALLLPLGGSHRVSIPRVQVPATWQSQSPSPVPLLLASRSPGRRDLECDRHENSCLALFSKLPSRPSISQVHSSAPEIVMSVEIAGSAPWCTYTTLEGVECQNSSGAKHRFGTTTKLNGRITPSPLAQKAWIPPRLQASLQAPPPHHCSGLYGHAKSTQPAWLAAS